MTAATLNPSLVNIYAQVFAYTTAVMPLLADTLGLSIAKTKLVYEDALLIALIDLIANAQTPSEPNQANQLIKSCAYLDTWLDFHAFDTQTFEQLSTQPNPISATHLSFGIHYLVDNHLLEPKVAEQCLHLSALLLEHFIDSCCVDMKLSHQDKATWLVLQSHFITKQDGSYPEQTTVILDKFKLKINPPNNKHSNYQHKFTALPSFDQSSYAIANHRWLVELALYLKHNPTPLMIGQQPKQHPLIARPLLPYVLGLAALVLAIMLALLVYHHISQSTAAATETDKKAEVIIQDIAIIRTDDPDNLNTPDNTEQTDNQSYSPNKNHTNNSPQPSQ